jgi:hypothetical protein
VGHFHEKSRSTIRHAKSLFPLNVATQLKTKSCQRGGEYETTR